MMTSNDPFVRTERAIQAAKKKPDVAPMREHLALLAVDPAVQTEGIATLRRILLRGRYDDQGGYSGYSKRKRRGAHWSFALSSLPQATPEEFDALFALAGIAPDEIVNDGCDCKTCGNARLSKNGERAERGYVGPCLHCKRPLMSHWVPVGSLIKRKDGKPWLDEDTR